MRAAPHRSDVLPLIRRALAEDRARADVTSRLLPRGLRIRAAVVARAPGVLAGVDVAAHAFRVVDRSLRCRIWRHAGASVRAGTTILTVEGRAASIFAAERTALNFLTHLSGIATLTHRFVRGARAVPVFDTRKTIPGLRDLERDAVRAGGGRNHRRDLSTAILVKTNHLHAFRGSRLEARGSSIEHMVRTARRLHPNRFVEIEVTSLREFRAALQARPDAILLDNWPIPRIRTAVALRAHSPLTRHHAPLIEVSGGVTLANIRRLARTGVDRISVGRLTHSAPALDVSLRVSS